MAQLTLGRALPLTTAGRELPVRAVAVVALVTIAYNYSLFTLARGLSLQTPLAYLALVPVIALVLAAARLRMERRPLPIHDRQVDWIVGVGLLATATAVLVLGPEPTSSTFWLQRIDLLTLPLFVAGIVALLFGVRRVWSLRVPIAFLLLAWPVPFQLLLATLGDGFTRLTGSAVAAVMAAIPLARVVPGENTLLVIGQDASAFGVTINSACAGMNSFVGFLLLGTALLYVVRGAATSRVLWLAVGLALVFALNVARIFAIVAAGVALGPDAALGVLHPVGGLIVFNIGVLAMIALMPRFGLRFVAVAETPRPSTHESTPDGPDVTGPRSEVAASSRPREAVSRAQVRSAFIASLVVAGLLGTTNAAYARYETISGGTGDTRLKSLDVRSADLPGWRTTVVEGMTAGKFYFGADSTWDRVFYTPTPAATPRTSEVVYVDVITTSDAGTFAAYGLDACYRFHGYQIASIANVDVGAGVDAQVIDYTNRRTKTDWSALWWEWPYRAGSRTRYQRVVVFMANGPQATYAGVRGQNVGTQDRRFAETDGFLVAIGRQIVERHLPTAAR